MPKQKTRWVKIGQVGVGTATVVIGDPSDFRFPGTRGHNLLEKECDNFYKGPETQPFKACKEPWKSREDPGCAFVLSTTGYGDGSYDVFAKLVDEGHGEIVMELRIRFDYAVGFDKPGGEIHDIPVREQFERLLERDKTNRLD